MILAMSRSPISDMSVRIWRVSASRYSKAPAGILHGNNTRRGFRRQAQEAIASDNQNRIEGVVNVRKRRHLAPLPGQLQFSHARPRRLQAPELLAAAAIGVAGGRLAKVPDVGEATLVEIVSAASRALDNPGVDQFAKRRSLTPMCFRDFSRRCHLRNPQKSFSR